jgi:hypothetical protein
MNAGKKGQGMIYRQSGFLISSHPSKPNRDRSEASLEEQTA